MLPQIKEARRKFASSISFHQTLSEYRQFILNVFPIALQRFWSKTPVSSYSAVIFQTTSDELVCSVGLAPPPHCHRHCHQLGRQRHHKITSLPLHRIDNHTAADPFHRLLHDGQLHTGPLKTLICPAAFEYLENAVLMLRCDADPLVAHVNLATIADHLMKDLDPRGLALSGKLQSITDQVRK